MSSMTELISYLVLSFTAIALGVIVLIILIIYSVCLGLSYKKGSSKYRCLGKRCVIPYLICYFITLILLWTATALVWPRSYSTSGYMDASWANTDDSLRTEGVRTGMQIGMLHRTSIDCEDSISEHEATSVTIENALKWVQLQTSDALDVSTYDWYALDKAVDRIRAHNQYLRGHALVWDSLEITIPSALNKAISSDKQQSEATEAMNNHFNAVMLRYADVIRAWDVVNEPIKGDPPAVSGEYQGPLFRAFGEHYIDEAFKLAHNILVDHNMTDTLLFLNEAFADYSMKNAKVIAFFALIDSLQARNVAIDCIGIQGHGFYNIPDENSIQMFIDEIIARGLCFEFTEIDVRLRLFGDEEDPYESQGNALAIYYRICAQYNNSICPGVTLWGVTDITAWYDSFPPFWTNRPNEPFLHDIEAIRKPGWKEAMNILRNLPNSTDNNTFAPKYASGATSLAHSCSGNDLVYKQGEWMYIVLMCFSVLLPIFIVIWIVLWRQSMTKYQKMDTSPDESKNKDQLPAKQEMGALIQTK